MSSTETIVSYTSPQGITAEKTLQEILAQAQYTVLYFYPKDNTPGCTIEAREFSDTKPYFHRINTQIIGVSKDSAKSHCGFQEKQDLTIGLISDTEKVLHALFHAEGMKKFMGKEYIGTLRNTYLLDNQGALLYKWENVTPLGHAHEVLEYVKSL